MGPQYHDHNLHPLLTPPKQHSDTPEYQPRESSSNDHAQHGKGLQGKSLGAQAPVQSELPNTITFEFN